MASCMQVWRWQNNWGASSEVWDCLARKAAERAAARHITHGTYQLASRAYAVRAWAEGDPALADLNDDLALLVAEFAFCDPIGPFGGGGGSPFSDEHFEAHTLKSVMVSTGGAVDCIGLNYHRKYPGEVKTLISHGNRSYHSHTSTFEIEDTEGEYISAANVRSGSLVDGIQFVTSKGRLSPWFGGHGGGLHVLQFPAPLRYISGRCGNSLDQIMFHF